MKKCFTENYLKYFNTNGFIIISRYHVLQPRYKHVFMIFIVRYINITLENMNYGLRGYKDIFVKIKTMQI